MAEVKREWYFIVNPRAGSGKTMSEWVPAEKKLDRMGVDYITAYTDHKRHATALAHDAAAEGYRRIAAVGGDGSLHETLTGICQWCDETGTDTSEFILGVFPIGSGNDWIKGTGVPHDTSAVVSLLAKESFGRMDVVKVRSAGDRICYMANVGGVGFDSHVCQRVNVKKEAGMRGKKIYLNALRYTMMNISAINIRVVADGVDIFCGSAYSVALGNGRYSGSGMRQVPEADMDDNLLDVTVIPRSPLIGLIPELPRLFNGSMNESKKAVTARCSSLQILPMDEGSSDIIEVDGEIEGRLPLCIEMENRKIGIVVG